MRIRVEHNTVRFQNAHKKTKQKRKERIENDEWIDSAST